MLRYYDEIGLLHPANPDPFTGYRYHEEHQLSDAGRIRYLRNMGFSLTEVGAILSLLQSGGSLEPFLMRRKEELLSEEKTVTDRLRLLDTASEWLRKGNSIMNYSVTLKTFPERKVASVRAVLPSYEEEGRLWNILCEETDSMPLVPDEPCLCSVVYHDNEFKEQDVEVEIQKTVRGDYADTEHVKFHTEPAVTVASAVHNGSYDGLDAAMEAVAQWVRDNGYVFSGPAFNIYHVSPYETDDPEKFVTEVCYPVGKR